MDGPVFKRLEDLCNRRQALEGFASTPAEFSPISNTEIDELRRLARPPQVVRECLEVVYACLNIDEVNKQLVRLQPGCRLNIKWATVQTMLARFQSLYPAMRNYDLTALISSPAVADHIAHVYFMEGHLSEERVKRASVACAALFRWCSQNLSRVRAALELAEVNAEIIRLEAQAQSSKERWRVEADEGWLEFDQTINLMLVESEHSDQPVSFQLGNQSYKIDMGRRTQWNCSTGFARAIRPPGNRGDIQALQGFWRLSGDGLAEVRGATVILGGRVEESGLEVSEGGEVNWECSGGRWTALGHPLEIVWSSGEEQVAWTPIPNPKEREEPAKDHNPPDGSPQSGQWLCKTEDGWHEFPGEVNSTLQAARLNGGAIEYTLHGNRYKVDMPARVQTNLLTKFQRPIRLQTSKVSNLWACQGSWAVDGESFHKVRVRSAKMWFDGRESTEQLQPQASGGVQWRHRGALWTASGNSLKIVWTAGQERLIWHACAAAS